MADMDELISGIQILFGSESMTTADRTVTARMVDELAEWQGERGLNILRAIARGEISAAGGYEALYASLH